MVDLKEIKNLSISERISLVEAIWESIGMETNSQDTAPFTEEQLKELDRRIDSYEKGESKIYSWEEIKRKLGYSDGLSD